MRDVPRKNLMVGNIYDQRRIIFKTKYKSKDQLYKVVINRGICKNTMEKVMIQNLN